MEPQKQILIYQTTSGKRPFSDWLKRLADKITVARVWARIKRIEAGNYGDVKGVGQGVQELRLSFGAGYRVYFGDDGGQLVILLTGGDKSSQSEDIAAAQRFWSDYQSRK